MMGPKDSSRAMNMWSCTSVKTVGSKKKPGGRRGIRDPPASPLLPHTGHKPHGLSTTHPMMELVHPPPGASALSRTHLLPSRLPPHRPWPLHGNTSGIRKAFSNYFTSGHGVMGPETCWTEIEFDPI